MTRCGSSATSSSTWPPWPPIRRAGPRCTGRHRGAHGSAPDTGGAADLDGLRDWLQREVAAKAVIRARIATTVVELGRGLAVDAGVDPRRPATRFLDEAARAAALEASTTAVLRVVDLAGLQRQAEAATRARARARGTGPIGHVTALVYRFSGRETHAADPEAYLMRWRERGSLAPAVESLRESLGDAAARG